MLLLPRLLSRRTCELCCRRAGWSGRELLRPPAAAAASRDVAAEPARSPPLAGAPLSTAPQAPPQQPVVLIVSGPSGVGKDAVVRLLLQRRPALRFVVTATTRPKRPGEVHGVDYLFLQRSEFDALLAKDELLEHALVYGEYKGIPKAQVRDALALGCDVVLRLDVQGAAKMRSLLPGAVLVFLVAESEVALVQRLESRQTELPEKLALRAATAREEMRRIQDFDYVVVNAQGRVEEAAERLAAILDSERCRVKRLSLQL